jgi:hypothetical protein
MVACESGVLDDFFAFDPINKTWKNLSGLVSGVLPGPRHSFGFASAGGKIFVFGGERDEGQFLELYPCCYPVVVFSFESHWIPNAC